jgi:hypothetical protein
VKQGPLFTDEPSANWAPSTTRLAAVRHYSRSHGRP